MSSVSPDGSASNETRVEHPSSLKGSPDESKTLEFIFNDYFITFEAKVGCIPYIKLQQFWKM